MSGIGGPAWPVHRDPLLSGFEDGCDVALDVVRSEVVADAWDTPSALDGFTVGALVGHLYGTVRLFERALDVPLDSGWQMVRLVDFYAANRVDDPSVLGDRFHQSIRGHAAELAHQGAAVLAGKFAAVTGRLRALVPSLDGERPVPVWRVSGAATTVTDYLRTRVVELVVHADDLATSVGLPTIVPAGAATVAVDVFVELARARAGDLAVLRAFSRVERSLPDALRVL